MEIHGYLYRWTSDARSLCDRRGPPNDQVHLQGGPPAGETHVSIGQLVLTWFLVSPTNVVQVQKATPLTRIHPRYSIDAGHPILYPLLALASESQIGAVAG